VWDEEILEECRLLQLDVLCRLFHLMCGSGFRIHQKVIQFMVFMICLLLRRPRRFDMIWT